MTYRHNNKDPNLNNLHHAMEYSPDGLPHVRVTLGSDTITITGSVNVGTEVKINNTEEQSIPVHLTDDPIAVTQSGTWNVGIGTDGQVTLKAGSAVIGKVDVNNWPATQAVTGTFWQTTQPISGTVTIQDGGNTITVDGTVTANVTFPTTQQVSGTVALDSNSLSALENINATVSGTVELGTATLTALENVGVTGTVTVQDGGGSITVDGTVSASVSGTVELGATTLTALENTTVTISGTPTVNIGTMPEVEIKNDAGNPIPVEWVYGNGASLIPWEVQVARGKISGVTNLNISGYNGDVGTTYMPLWHNTQTYTYPVSAINMRVWSDSASDTNVSVLVSGLDANYAPLTETVVLTNGATGVLTTNQFLRINNLSLTRTPMNVGVIFCGNSAKSNYYCAIEAGAGRSQQTIYTVPAGYTFYLTQSNWFTNNTGNNVGLYRSWTQTPTGVINVILTFPFPVTYNSRKVVPRAYTEKTDIQWQVQSKSGASQIGGQIEGFLIANSTA